MRKNASKATLTQAEIRSQLILQANQAQEKFKESEYAEEFADEIVPNVRAEVAPPLQPEKTRCLIFTVLIRNAFIRKI